MSAVMSLKPDEIIEKMRKGDLTVCVIGLGWMGMPTACLFAEAGAKVIGVDANQGVVEAANRGKSPIAESGLDVLVKKYVSRGQLQATDNIADAVSKSDVIIIILPTLIDRLNRSDYSAVEKACKEIGRNLRKGSLVIFESTVGPGVTEGIVKDGLEKASGFKAENDFGLAYSPIRATAGRVLKDIVNYPRIVGAVGKGSLEAASAVLSTIIKGQIIKVRNVKTAEATKLFENVYRDVNIALANELAVFCEAAGIDYDECVKAANTQPYAHLHTPGIGVGGHCLDGGESLFVREDGVFRTVEIGDLFSQLSGSLHAMKQIVMGDERVYPENLYALSFDSRKKIPEFRRILWLSRRLFSGRVLELSTSMGRSLKVTEDHPIVYYEAGKMKIKLAKELRVGDRLPIITTLPTWFGEPQASIDLIGELTKRDDMNGIRVRALYKLFSRTELAPILRKMGLKEYQVNEVFRRSSMRLGTFVEAEKSADPISRNELWLYTGRGNVTYVPAIIDLDGDFWRLIGYYLSEGCITSDGTLRIRFSFRRDEKTYAEDLCSILEKIGIKYSQFLQANTLHIKVSSKILGFLIKDVLKCGVDSYTKNLPREAFNTSEDNIIQLLTGLFRGDGSVEIDNRTGAVSIGYSTVSPTLHQEVLLILQKIGFIPSCRRVSMKRAKKLSRQIRIFGPLQVRMASRFFEQEKQLCVLKYLSYRRVLRRSKGFRLRKNFAAVHLNEVREKLVSRHPVYNLELDGGTHTFVTTDGIITHNCIPVNPHFLLDEAEDLGVKLQLVRLVRRINDAMPKHTINLVIEALRACGKGIRRARIAVLGVSYRANVKEARFTPTREVATALEKRGARLNVFDPYFTADELRKMEYQGVGRLEVALDNADCVLVTVGHDEFKKIRTKTLTRLLHRKAAVVDCANVFVPAEIEEAGIIYRGIGRGVWSK